MELHILHEDDHILVCEKPPGVPSQSDKTADYDMVNQLKNYLYEKDNRIQPYIGLIHRLDRPVGGIMVFAKTPFAAKNLSEQIRLREMKKHYMAVVTQDLTEELNQERQLLTDYLVKDQKTNLSRVTSEKDRNGKKAQLYYQVLKVSEGLSFVEVELITGRHHQIRVQMSKHKGGLWGDTKYNPLFQKKEGFHQLALFAYRLEFSHPKTKKLMKFRLMPTGEPFKQLGFS